MNLKTLDRKHITKDKENWYRKKWNLKWKEIHCLNERNNSWLMRSQKNITFFLAFSQQWHGSIQVSVISLLSYTRLRQNPSSIFKPEVVTII